MIISPTITEYHMVLRRIAMIKKLHSVNHVKAKTRNKEI